MALIDAYGSEVIITSDFIRYRERVIDFRAIAVFQVKQRKLLINNFHQNTSLPTMCIYFKTKEEALSALDILTDSYYDEQDEQEPPTKSKGWSSLLAEFLGF